MPYYARFTPEEVEYLSDRVGTMTNSALAKEFQQHFKSLGLPDRSELGITRKCRELRQTDCPPLYTEQEIEFLAERVGSIPTSVLITQFQTHFAKFPNLPQRSGDGIIKKIQKIQAQGNIHNEIEDYFTPAYLAQMLGVHHRTVNRWIKKGLTAKKIMGFTRKRLIRRGAVKNFILKNPLLFQKIEADMLFWILEDKEEVKRVKSSPPPPNTPKKVRRLNDGATFESIDQAAKANYLNRRCLSLHIKEGKPYGGYLWEFV